jgi:S1-C subfamily serine protease
MTTLDELSALIAHHAELVGPSLVGVGEGFRGSGFVIGPGQVLTNAHNLRRGETTLTSTDGSRLAARLVGMDEERDLAVLAVETGPRPALPWSEGSLRVGSPVLAAAFLPPAGVRVTLGFVSAIAQSFRGPGGRRVGGAVEHTAPLAPGSSGGPLLDLNGAVVGVNTHRLGEGFYLAQPADAAFRERVAALARGEVPPRRPRLGVVVAPPWAARRLRRLVGLPEADGILVRAVEEGSLAETAGLREGDLIVEMAGQSVTDPDVIGEVLAAARGPITVRVLRGASEVTLTIPVSPPG